MEAFPFQIHVAHDPASFLNGRFSLTWELSMQSITTFSCASWRARQCAGLSRYRREQVFQGAERGGENRIISHMEVNGLRCCWVRTMERQVVAVGVVPRRVQEEVGALSAGDLR